MHMPPPVHGAAMVGQWIHDSKLINKTFECHYINPSASSNITEVGKISLKKIIFLFSIQYQILKAIIKVKPDICYYTPTSDGWGIYRDSVSILLMKLCRRKVILHMHNKGVRNFAKKRLAQIAYKINFSNVKVILIAKELYDDISDFVNPKDLFYLPNGLPPTLSEEKYKEVIKQRKKSLYKVHFLYLSNMMSEKGIWILLEACTLLTKNNKDFECHYVGNWGDTTYKEFQKKISERKLEKHVFVHGPKYGIEKEKFFTNSDVFVFPTFYHGETFGLVLLEAMEYGLPCISTYEGGIPSIIQNGENGILIEQQNIEQLKNAMLSFIENPDKNDMGKKGREIYLRQFTISKFEERLNEILLHSVPK